MTVVSEEALAAFAAAVGEEFVDAAEATRRRYARSTLPVGTTPGAVVRPASTAQVQAVVRAASAFGVALHPISGGRNWGYSDASGLRGGEVILDLGRMDRIVEINDELAYATIEPGVTQGQLAGELRRRGDKLWLDATGAGPDASIVGNVLERGFGHTPYGDRYLNACDFEVVLPDGRVVRTGLGHFRDAQAAAVHKWGVGPALDGIFAQSNLGIVTRMTVWLLPRPRAFTAFFFTIDREDGVGALVDSLRRLRLGATLTTPVHVANDLRVIAMLDSYPWDEMRGATPLSPEVRAALRARHGIEPWSGSGALYGTKKEVAAAQRAVKTELRRVPGLRRLSFVDDRRLRLAGALAGVARTTGVGTRIIGVHDRLQLAYDLLRGQAAPALLQGALWRARGDGEGRDPFDRGAGLLWLAPVLPATSAHVDRVNHLLEPVFEQHGFEFLVTLSFVTPRALCATTTIAFDRGDQQECENARRCYDAALEALLEAGYPPYRFANPGMAKLDATSEVFFDVTAAIKDALDPTGIISPGRYDPAAARRLL